MQQVESRYSSKDGLQIWSQSWRPEGALKAVVCLVHGIGEHSGRYAHVAEALCAAGYALCACDLRGHGRSGGPRGHAPTYDAMLDDIDLLLNEAGQRYPGRPQFLYGHSLGGNLVINHALRRHPVVGGVVATSPCLRTTTPTPVFKLWLGKICYQVRPGLTMATGLAPDGLSRDHRVI